MSYTNETVAQDYFPISEAEAKARGYVWRKPEDHNYRITLPAANLPETIQDVSDTITQEIIGCASRNPDPQAGGCTTAFRIVPQELAFYREMNLPLPRVCPNCRHRERLTKCNPLKLWHRRCDCNHQSLMINHYQNTTAHSHGTDPCPNEFETAYAPERPEIIYCEQCLIQLFTQLENAPRSFSGGVY
ncbi:MAG: hypothetical protein HY978_02470 [Candidatus Liptonbacteria bacterium]|nr:hypothetical protein [Candidatus Liptonbacteria bacterium]